MESIGAFCKRTLPAGFMQTERIARKKELLYNKLNKQKRLEKLIKDKKIEAGKIEAIASKDYPFVPVVEKYAPLAENERSDLMFWLEALDFDPENGLQTC